MVRCQQRVDAEGRFRQLNVILAAGGRCAPGATPLIARDASR